MGTLPAVRQDVQCGCCGGALPHALDRRRFMRLAGAGLALTLPASLVLAAEGDYEAMVLACIDPRMQEPVWKYLAGRDLTGKYSQFLIAGAAIGVVAPVFKDWHKAYWDNLATTIQVHRIKKVIAIEAQSEFLPAISSNLQRNNCTNKTIVVLGLVGAKRGLFSKVSERQMASHWRDEPPLISLPDLFARLGIGRVDFLKVDIEGSEFDVFSGDLRWLEMVNRIAMEVHTNFGSVSSLSTTLREAGFRVWLTDARQRAVSTLKSSSGYLFARKEASDRAGRKILA